MQTALPTKGWRLDLNSTVFNVSLGLPTYLSELSSKFITRLKRLDELLSQDDPPNPPLYATASNGMPTGSFMFHQAIPSPWGFAFSGYAIGLLAVALLLNRIQHIVVPPRTVTPGDSRRQLSSPLFAPFWPIWRLLFPIDLSSTLSRCVLRIPSIYLLAKAVSSWVVVLLQSSGLFPRFEWSWLQYINSWGAKIEMEELCWASFIAVCLALCVGALTRGLEGIGTENTAPFNLFGYAFLLHIYASPVSHSVQADDLPARPNIHALIIIFIPLLQLSMIHFLGVKKEWSKQRLIPTTLCSLISLIHFHSVFWTSPTSYPLLNYFPAFLESFLALATILACGLNALTQILLEGAITRPIFGHAESLGPKWDEDFSIVLLRLGTASLEATNVAGLGNEVGSISLSDGLDVYGDTPDSSTLEITRGGVSSSRARHGRRGFTNEVKNIKAVSNTNGGDFWMSTVWYTELARFWIGVWKVIKGFWRLIKSGSLRIPRENTPDADERPRVRFARGSSVSEEDEEDFDEVASMSSLSQHSGSEDYSEEEEDVFGSTSAMPHVSATPLRRRHSRREETPIISISDEEDEDEVTTGDFWTDYARDRRKNQPSVDVPTVQDAMLEESRRNCVVCTCQPREIICWPCRCLALCDDCRENLASRTSASKHTCPCCRRSVDGFSRIYIP